MKKIFLFILILINFLYFSENKIFSENFLEISGENFSGKVGDEKIFSVNVKNFSEVAGFQVFLNYNKDFLEFIEILENNFNSENLIEDGALNFIWDDFENPVSLSYDSDIFQIKFKVLSENLNNGGSEIFFSDKTKFFDEFGNEISSIKNNSKFFIENFGNVSSENISKTSSSGGASGYRFYDLYENENFEISSEINSEINNENYNQDKKISKENIEKNIENNLLKNSVKYFFTDIENNWAKNYILSLSEKNIIDNSKNFYPENFLTRVDLLKIVNKAYNLGFSENDSSNGLRDSFVNLEKNYRYFDYFIKSLELGIIDNIDNFDNFEKGSDLSRYRLGDFVNRAESLKIILKAYGIKDFGNYSNNFSDVEKGIWFEKYLNFSYANGFISLFGNGKFGPEKFITRGEIAEIICKTLDFKINN